MEIKTEQKNDAHSVPEEKILVEKKSSSLKDLSDNDFAAAFPEWDLVPPLQVIKRVRRG